MAIGEVVPVFKMFAWFDRVRIFYILSVVVQFYVKMGFRLSDILFFGEQKFS